MGFELQQAKRDEFFGDRYGGSKGALGDAFVETKYYVLFTCDDCRRSQQVECEVQFSRTGVSKLVSYLPLKLSDPSRSTKTVEVTRDARQRIIARLVSPIALVVAWPAVSCENCVTGPTVTDADVIEFVEDGGRLAFEAAHGTHRPSLRSALAPTRTITMPAPEPPDLEWDEEDWSAPALCSCFGGPGVVRVDPK